jgi:hypothetical protein
MNQFLGVIGCHFAHWLPATGQLALAAGDDRHDATALLALVNV